MSHTENINQIFFDLLQEQTFVEAELDYCILDKHKPQLQMLANIGNCIVSVLDVYRKQHVFHSSNFAAVLGYRPEEVEQYGEHFLNAIIHPGDFPLLMQNGLTAFKFYLSFSVDEKLNYKMINEFRDEVYGGTPLGWAKYMQPEEKDEATRKKLKEIELFLSGKTYN